MVKKKWIDKSKATTFTLTRKYVDSDEEDAGASKQHQGGGFGPGEEDMDPELAELFGMASIYDDASYELSEERRQAILELGLPDDGYDYLRHLRAAGPQRAGGLKPLSSNQLDASQQASTSAGLPAASASAAAAAPSSNNAASTSSAPGPRTAADIAAEVLAAAPDGPSVHIDAPRWAAPPPDVRLVDARALSLAEQHAKRQDELSALEAAATVSAFSRTADAKLAARGRLAAELAELEAAMRTMEEEEERVRYQHSTSQAKASSTHAKAHASHHHQQQQQQQQHPQQQQQQGASAQEEVEEEGEEGDWDEWMDQFVVTATAPPPAPAPYSATRALQPAHEGGTGDAGLQGEGMGEEGSEWERGEESEEGCESEGDIVGPLGGGMAGLAPGLGKAGAHSVHSARMGGSSRAGSVAGGAAREGSIASSYWRDERCDRRDTLDVIDQRFEHVALQYEDGDMGELDEEVAERARGTADISAFGNVLQEFLDEQAQLESEQGAVPPADRWEGVDASTVPVLADMDDSQFEAWMQRKQANGNIAGTSANRKVEALEDQDPAVIAAVKARIAAVAARMEAQGTHLQGGEQEVEPLGPEGRKVVVEDRGERWDCESVLSLRSNLENHPRKIVESVVKPQSRTGSRNGPAITLSAKTGMPVSSGRAHALKSSLAAGSIPEEGGEQGPVESAAHRADSSDECSSSGSGSDSGGEDAASVAFSIATTARQKGESAEERRARKNAVKELRRASRASKKELKGLFKAEAGKQKRQAAGKAAAGGARGGSTFVIP